MTLSDGRFQQFELFQEARMEFAKLGDIIECEVKHPSPSRIRMILSSAQACAYGNELLSKKDSGWRISERA